jgi:hypothetical protein
MLSLAASTCFVLGSEVYARSPEHDGRPHEPMVQSLAVDQMQTSEQANPIGSDPLTPNEITLIKKIASESPALKLQSDKASKRVRPSRTALLSDVQFVFTQRHIEKKDAPPELRRADVFYYDYASDEVLHQVINVKTGEVEEVFTSSDLRLPVASIEATAAVQLILDHPQLGSTLRKLHKQVSGHELALASNVAAQGGLFFRESALGTPLERVTAICEFHRCVQLFLPYDETHFIDSSNLVIDLSAGQLLWVDEALTVYINSTPVNLTFNVYLPVVVR